MKGLSSCGGGSFQSEVCSRIVLTLTSHACGLRSRALKLFWHTPALRLGGRFCIALPLLSMGSTGTRRSATPCSVGTAVLVREQSALVVPQGETVHKHNGPKRCQARMPTHSHQFSSFWRQICSYEHWSARWAAKIRRERMQMISLSFCKASARQLQPAVAA